MENFGKIGDYPGNKKDDNESEEVPGFVQKHAVNPNFSYMPGVRKNINQKSGANLEAHGINILRSQIESEIPEAFADNKDIKIEVKNSSINISKKGKRLAQVVFGKQVLVKSKTNLPEQKFEYKEKNSIITALKNIV